MMRRFCFLLAFLACFGLRAQVANVTYNLTNFFGSPAPSYSAVTLTPLQASGNGVSLLFSQKQKQFLGTNSSVTFSNVAMGYSYQVAFYLNFFTPPQCWTNSFPIGLSGSVNGANYVFYDFFTSAATVGGGSATNAITNNQQNVSLEGNFSGNGGALTNLNGSAITNTVPEAANALNLVGTISGGQVVTPVAQSTFANATTNASQALLGTNVPSAGEVLAASDSSGTNHYWTTITSDGGNAVTNNSSPQNWIGPQNLTNAANNIAGTFTGNGSGLTNQIGNVVQYTMPLNSPWVVLDQVYGNDATAVTNNYTLACSNLQTAVNLLQTNGLIGGTIICAPGQTISLDYLGTQMYVSNNNSLVILGNSCTFITTNKSLSPFICYSNTSLVEYDDNWSLPFGGTPGQANLYQTTGSFGAGILNQEIYGGSSYNHEDCWYQYQLGRGFASGSHTNLNLNNRFLFPRLTVFNHKFYGTWDIGLIVTGAGTLTNTLVQFVGDSFTITNLNYNTSGGTIHGISTEAAFCLVKDCVFNITNTYSGAAWNIQPILSSGFGRLNIINCQFNTYNASSGWTTNVIYSYGEDQPFPEIYNCACGTNLWLTGDGVSTTYLNIRTRDGNVYQHQVVP